MIFLFKNDDRFDLRYNEGNLVSTRTHAARPANEYVYLILVWSPSTYTKKNPF